MLQSFFYELNFSNDTKIIVVKGPIFNAFAVPGNTIVVFDEVLRSVKSYPELAALLAHEYSHIKNRHGMRTLAHEDLRQLLADAFFGGGNGSDDFIKNSNKLLTSKKSRGFEKQADKEGLELLRVNKINEQGFIDLLKTIDTIESSEKSKNIPLSIYFSTHPDTKDRIEFIEKNISDNTFENNITLDNLFKQLNN